MPLPETLPEGAVILHESITAGLAEMLGLAPDAADQAAYDVLRRVLETCGGEYFYVPKDIRLAAHGRDIEVWRKFTGHNQRQLAREFGITTIFYETLISPKVAESIAGDLHLKTDVLDPLEGITDKSRGSDYLQVMDSNLTALKTANGCS